MYKLEFNYLFRPIQGDKISDYGKRYNSVWYLSQELGGIWDIFKYRGKLPAWVVPDVRENGATYMDFSMSGCCAKFEHVRHVSNFL